MTELSKYLLPTEKLAPADAEATSHKLMVRAGLIRQLATGLWTYLPAGWKTHRKVEQILRSEMDAIGGQEVLMPVLQPRDIWHKTGRDSITEMFKLKDRKEAEMVLAMTHEENVTTHVAQLASSYRDLPLILYHCQTKLRDEPRPRSGVLRTREFMMKDSYSFDCDAEGLDRSYQLHIEAYDRIFDRTGIEWYRVESDVGMMGGTSAHEYMAPCEAGEDSVVLAEGYAANLEVATADAQPVQLPDSLLAPEEVKTPDLKKIEEVSNYLGVAPGCCLKAFPVILDSGDLQLVLLRGDHTVNETKLRNFFGEAFRQATEEEIEAKIGPPGFIGPVEVNVQIILDTAVQQGGYIVGANRPDLHLRGVEPGRDFKFTSADIRSVVEGDQVDGKSVRVQPAIEVGNIFKLGTRYSEPLGAKFLDKGGKEQPIWMGSYGIGPARIVAAAIEQGADDKGVVWPTALAPFDLHLVSLGKPASEERSLSDKLYKELQNEGFDVLYDNRDSASPGQKFADAELLGCPLRITVGKRTVDSGEVELQERQGLVDHKVPLKDVSKTAGQLWNELK